jgi:NitT/TauT family transport system permease protein
MLGLLTPPLVTLMTFLAVWLFVSCVVLAPEQRFLLPPPNKVLRVGILDPSNLAEVLRALRSTTIVALTGLVLAAGVGLGLAILMSQAPWLERALYPYAVVLQTIPILALVPVIGFWFGFGFQSRVLVCALISVFPIITNTLFGIQSVQRGHHELFTLHGACRYMRLWRLELPAALPAIITGLRISAGLSVVGAIVGDFFFRQGDAGIGRLIDVYRGRLQAEQMITAVLFSSLLGLLFFSAFGLLRRLTVARWEDTDRMRYRQYQNTQ